MRVCGIGHVILTERNSKVFEEVAKKIDVKIIVPVKQNIRLAQRMINNGINIIDGGPYLPYTTLPLVGGVLTSYMPKINLIVKKIRNETDILYTMMEPFTLLTASTSFLSKKYWIKHVFFTWENIDHKFFGIKKFLSRYSYETMRNMSIKYSDGIIAGNNEAKQIMIKHGFKKKIEIFPQTGIDIDQFNPKVYPKYKEKLGLTDKIVVVFAGNVAYEKGVDVLIDSVPKVVNTNKDVHFLICGNGNMKEILMKKVKINKLDKFVTFIDRVSYNEMPYIHASADIFTYPSIPTYFWKEQFGFSIVEAMATEKPVIVTNVGAMPEIVKNNEIGFIVEPDNSKQLADAIIKLADNSKLRKEFGKKGRETVEKKYSNEVIAKEMIKFFETILRT